MITIQFLEPGPVLERITPSQAELKLMEAIDCLPISVLVLGWDIPSALEEKCSEITSHAGIKLYRWHPLLTGDGRLNPKLKWRSQNIAMLPIPGYRGLPEFTFFCPNNPEARIAALTHVTNIAKSGIYDGIFLDRMRFPSPASDPKNYLSCFCKSCSNAAQGMGINLADVRQSLREIEDTNLLRVLCGEPIQPISTFLDFRQNSITQFVGEICNTIQLAGLEIGLDCFSPSLSRMVGQDLSKLTPLADWTKIMIYGHAYGPASLPFELTDMANWLIKRHISEVDALATLARITDLPLPDSLSSLHQTGLLPVALANEYYRGRQMAENNKLLAGIELVEIPGISELDQKQIDADLRGIQAIGADGLSLSWDLWHIPLERLEFVRSIWSKEI